MNVISSFKKSHVGHALTSQISDAVSNLNKEIMETDTEYKGPQITPLFSTPASLNITKPAIMKNYSENHIANTLKRISTLEGHLEKTKRKLKGALSLVKEKDIEIIKLKEQVRLLEEKQLDKRSSSMLKSDFYELLEISHSLQTRITNIENFLKGDQDIWFKPVSPDSDQFCQCSLENLEMPNLDFLLHRINELNFEAGEIHVCQKTKQGASFQNCESMTLTCFANGILLEGRAFREYSDVMTQIFIKDILDGFFPSELQNEYPRGVIFNVCDRRNEVYNENDILDSSVFKGQGCKLDSRSDDVVAKEFKVRKRKSPSHCDEGKLHKEKNNQLITNLSVDANSSAQIFEINNDIYRRKFGESVTNCRNRNSLLSNGNGGGDCTFAYRQNNERLVLPDITIKNGQLCNNKKSANKIHKQKSSGNGSRIIHLNPEAKNSDSSVLLKIRSLDNNNLYILTMQINETVGKLFSYLPEECRDCSIMYYKDSVNGIYLTNHDSTLKEYGILKNSVLVLSKPRKSKE